MQHEISEHGREEAKKQVIVEQPVSKQAKDETNLNQDSQETPKVTKKEDTKNEKKEAEAKSESNTEEQVDMSGK